MAKKTNKSAKPVTTAVAKKTKAPRKSAARKSAKPAAVAAVAIVKPAAIDDQIAAAVAADREATVRFLVSKNEGGAYALAQELREFWRA